MTQLPWRRPLRLLTQDTYSCFPPIRGTLGLLPARTERTDAEPDRETGAAGHTCFVIANQRDLIRPLENQRRARSWILRKQQLETEGNVIAKLGDSHYVSIFGRSRPWH